MNLFFQEHVLVQADVYQSVTSIDRFRLCMTSRLYICDRVLSTWLSSGCLSRFRLPPFRIGWVSLYRELPKKPLVPIRMATWVILTAEW